MDESDTALVSLTLIYGAKEDHVQTNKQMKRCNLPTCLTAGKTAISGDRRRSRVRREHLFSVPERQPWTLDRNGRGL